MRKGSKAKVVVPANLATRPDAKTVDNATGLAHFFCRDGVDFTNNTISDLKGNIVITGSAGIVLLDDHPTQKWFHSGLGTGSWSGTGTWRQWTDTDDGLFVVAGRLNDTGDGGESPSLTFHIAGAGGSASDSGFKVRCHPTGGTDAYYASIGTSVTNPQRVGAEGKDYILIAALDRTANLWRAVQYVASGGTNIDTNDAANVKVSGVPTTTVDISGITGTTSSSSFQGFTMPGKIYGMGAWNFGVGGLPSDWQEAALHMGQAWIDGAYKFWHKW